MASMAPMAGIKHDVMFKRNSLSGGSSTVRRQTTTVFGRVHQNAAPGATFAIYD